MKALLTTAAFTGALAGALSAQTIAITNARIHTMTAAPIERGTIVVNGGRIQAVGSGVAVPAGARVIDASGKTVTPGLLDSSTALGIVEIGQVAGTADASTTLGRLTAAFNVADGLNPYSTVIPVTRAGGITRAVVAPQPGSSLIAGQGIVIDLGADRAADMVHRNPVGMFAVLGERGAALAGGARGAALLVLREALQDAHDFAENRRAFDEDRRRPYALSRLDLEALGPVVRGELPLIIEAHRSSDLLAALRLAREFNLRLVLAGATEAWMVASELAAARVPVIINPMQNLPGFQNLGITLENAARLHAAGVSFAFGSFESHNARNLRQLAGNAVAYGLPHDAALRAMTIEPARIWGLTETYGTIEPGKDADLVVWSGDPLELTTTVERVLIRGRETGLENRQRMLFERYRTLPR